MALKGVMNNLPQNIVVYVNKREAVLKVMVIDLSLRTEILRMCGTGYSPGDEF